MSPTLPSFADVQAAARRIATRVHRSPVLSSQTLDELSGARLSFKCENFQRTGSFKFRGASNAVALLDDQTATRGVATHSSGNHGAALALAARQRGIPAHVVVPKDAVTSKVDSIQRYGGRVIFCEPTQAGREGKLTEIVAETGAESIPPYDDERIIAGQGTCALELIEQAGQLDALVAPVGGGGLISGTALVAKAQSQTIKVIGAEPAGADDTFRSLAYGAVVTDHHPDTICDGLRGHVGGRNFAIIERDVDRVLTVTDEQTVAAMKLIWQVLKIVVEASCATALAVILGYPELFRGERVGVILSGGNVDLDQLPWP